MNNEVFAFSLSKNMWSSPLDIYFRNATNGEIAPYKTEVSLSYDELFFNVNFNCLDNPFVSENQMTKHNDSLYNQEVFEIFISAGHEDSKKYLEIEINPNNALWIGKISNLSLGAEMQTIEKMISYEEAGIRHQVIPSENSWKGRLSIPWVLIGKSPSNEYRINFYRIRSRESSGTKDWVCNEKNCDFLCWSPTMSGISPAFHRPKKFGKMVLVN